MRQLFAYNPNPRLSPYRTRTHTNAGTTSLSADIPRGGASERARQHSSTPWGGLVHTAALRGYGQVLYVQATATTAPLGVYMVHRLLPAGTSGAGHSVAAATFQKTGT